VTKQLIEVAYDESVATLWLDRPPANAMNLEMMEQVNEALLGLRSRREIKVLVVRGRGEAFCTGVDPADLTPDKMARSLQVFHRIFETVRLLDVVAVAAVDGEASSGGFELAIGCNLVVASESARFALPEIDHGRFPPLACVVLPRAAPRRKAMEWILTGDEIPAQTLERHGLVNRVFADDEFEEGLRHLVARLVSKSGPVLQLAKRAQTESYYAAYEEALYKAENLYLRELMVLDDAKEGVRAVIDGRKPKWHDC
jgi:cyclohexa-1,5-dienecarbonyl-CoA hydratase